MKVQFRAPCSWSGGFGSREGPATNRVGEKFGCIHWEGK